MIERIEEGVILGAKIGLIPGGVCAAFTVLTFIVAPEVAVMYAMGTILWGAGGVVMGGTIGGALGGAIEITQRTANSMYSIFNRPMLLPREAQVMPQPQPYL